MEPFVSEIRMFSFDWAPRGWALCNGALLPIQQNQALFALLGVNFGGNGTSTFGLPDLRGRVPVHIGVSSRNSPSYSTANLGTAGGSETVVLTLNQMPTHTHTIAASTTQATLKPLIGNVLAAAMNKQNSQPTPIYAAYDAANQVAMAPDIIGLAGTGAPHQNCQPSLTMNFCIATQGIFPSRN